MNDWDYYPELEKIPPGMPEPPVTPQGNTGADGAAQAKPDCDNWQDDPSADERWNAGLDFGMVQLCAVLGVDPHMVTWDAATETLDGDVCAAIGNIFRTKYGDDFDPTASSVPSAQPAPAQASPERQRLEHPQRPHEADFEYADLQRRVETMGGPKVIVGILQQYAFAAPRQGSYAGSLWAIAEWLNERWSSSVPSADCGGGK